MPAANEHRAESAYLLTAGAFPNNPSAFLSVKIIKVVAVVDVVKQVGYAAVPLPLVKKGLPIGGFLVPSGEPSLSCLSYILFHRDFDFILLKNCIAVQRMAIGLRIVRPKVGASAFLALHRRQQDGFPQLCHTVQRIGQIVLGKTVEFDSLQRMDVKIHRLDPFEQRGLVSDNSKMTAHDLVDRMQKIDAGELDMFVCFSKKCPSAFLYLLPFIRKRGTGTQNRLFRLRFASIERAEQGIASQTVGSVVDRRALPCGKEMGDGLLGFGFLRLDWTAVRYGAAA